MIDINGAGSGDLITSIWFALSQATALYHFFREMASQGPFQDTPAVIAKVKTLINAQLKSVLKKEGLLVSGVKAAMQDRIISRKFFDLAKQSR